jgi:hypothetical protein
MWTAKLTRALSLLGAAAFLAGLLATVLLHAGGWLWLSAAGIVLYLLGMALMVAGLLTSK